MRPLPRLSGSGLAPVFGLLVIISGCDLTAPAPVPTTLVVMPHEVELDAIDATLPLSTTIRDETGSVLQVARVTWEVEDPSIVDIDSTGTIRALDEGETRIRARFGGAEGSSTVRVRQRPTGGDVDSGGGQTARAGTPLPDPIRFRLVDRLENPVPNLPVLFSTPDGGSVTPTQTVTGAGGEVEVHWTLGPEPGIQSLVTTADDRTFHLIASATDDAGHVPFRIHIEGVGPLSPGVLDAFRRGAARWERLMSGKLEPVLARAPAGRCGMESAPALDRVVSDLLVLVFEAPLDGPEGSAAAAGPCFIRAESSLPVVGAVILDVDDVAALQALDLLDDLVTHELGHVLGFGSMWAFFDLIRSPSLPDAVGADTHFIGPSAISAFDLAGGHAYPNARVPVENELGAEGVRDVHWRQSVFGVELMNPFLVPGVSNPLGPVTAGSLEDLGYPVEVGAAEPWTLPSAHVTPFEVDQADLFRIEHMPLRTPIHVIGDDGRIVPFRGWTPHGARTSILPRGAVRP